MHGSRALQGPLPQRYSHPSTQPSQRHTNASNHSPDPSVPALSPQVERLARKTTDASLASTPHERSFHARFSTGIQSLLQTLRTPPDARVAMTPTLAWPVFQVMT
jgi:hypothetical protein